MLIYAEYQQCQNYLQKSNAPLQHFQLSPVEFYISLLYVDSLRSMSAFKYLFELKKTSIKALFSPGSFLTHEPDMPTIGKNYHETCATVTDSKRYRQTAIANIFLKVKQILKILCWKITIQT